MPKFFATCPRGVEKSLCEELVELGVKRPKEEIAGVSFQGNWKLNYLVNTRTRIASRILYPVLDFPAYEPDHIYFNVLKHDWTKYISPDQTIAMDSKVRDSKIQDLRILSLKAKDAVVDQFREKFDARPNVRTDNPDLQISLRLVKNICTVAVDTSGGSLHERGYRVQFTQAPLKENLAAALIQMTGWKGDTPFVDPMCGSGTLCIEAATKAMGLNPRPRRRYAFERWLTFQKEAFEEVRNFESLTSSPPKILGFDLSKNSVSASWSNVKKAEVDSFVHFQKQDIQELTPPGPVGTLLVNPPYGERLGTVEELRETYQHLGEIIKTRFSGWKSFVLCSEPQLIEAMGIRPKKSQHLFNGSIPCRLYSF